MAIDYLRLQQKTHQLIKDFGRPMILKRTQIILSPGGEPIDEIITEQTVSAVQTEFDHRFVGIEGGAIGVRDVRFYISAHKLDPAFEDLSVLSELELVEPDLGRIWRFVHVKKLSPGKTILLFDVQAV